MFWLCVPQLVYPADMIGRGLLRFQSMCADFCVHNSGWVKTVSLIAQIDVGLYQCGADVYYERSWTDGEHKDLTAPVLFGMVFSSWNESTNDSGVERFLSFGEISKSVCIAVQEIWFVGFGSALGTSSHFELPRSRQLLTGSFAFETVVFFGWGLFRSSEAFFGEILAKNSGDC